VWASPDPAARVQATGVDARGRTQYRYSPAAEEEAATNKFGHLLMFGRTLPGLRTRVDRHLSDQSGDGPAHRVRRATAAAVRLLDRGLFRVGSERYARDNHTYGLTTLTADDAHVSGDVIEFAFVAKEHLPWRVTVQDAQVAEIVGALLADAAGPHAPLFSVATDEGRHLITSAVVNSYIHGATTAPATAKTFRTWGGTAAAAAVSAGASAAFSTPSNRADLVAYDAAASLLGNTRAVARRSYVHPEALEAGRAPAVVAAIADAAERTGSRDVRDVLQVDSVVVALVDELSRLDREQGSNGEPGPTRTPRLPPEPPRP
jgi:DNA topoisomerase-1